MTPSVRVHLDRVILRGVEPAGRGRASEALRAELTRLLTEHGVPEALHYPTDIARIDGGSFQLTSGLAPEDYGVRAARALYRGLGGRVPR